ncbi:amidase signature domain-containing protein [Pilobolus umbonatus]|nr:amidase signature domain-containing protein [Pilobolus umbonatus]
MAKVKDEVKKSEFNAPELYGWPLVMAANALETLPAVSHKVAENALLYKLRDINNLNEFPTNVPIPVDNISPSDGVISNKAILTLNAEHKSISPFPSFWDYHQAYTENKTSPLEVANKLLEKLRETENMHWIRFMTDDILKQAEASTERYQSHLPLSQLDGVFVTVKEEVDIKHLETKAGTSFINNGNPAQEDGTLVSRLRKAGAIIIGSAVMNELGWDTFSVNPNTGTPKNPYHLSHSCGGSSGGSAGCVAGGLVPVSIGADGGGSIRIPSAFCGLYGLKTTYGRVSGAGGAPLDPTVGAYGPIAATADDMALTYSIISGPDPKDPYSLLQKAVNLRNYDKYSDLSDITIATVPNWARGEVDPVILKQLDIFKEKLTALGAHFVEIEIPDLDLCAIAHTLTICSELYTYASRFKQHHKSYLPHTRLMMSTARTVESRDYIRAQQIRTRMMNHMKRIFQTDNVDLILVPSAAIISPEIPKKAMTYGMSNAKMTIQSMVFSMLGNLTGIPGVNVPAGFHNEMPIGLQFMASWWNEALLCRIAKACERLSDIERKRPEHNWFAPEL